MNERHLFSLIIFIAITFMVYNHQQTEIISVPKKEIVSFEPEFAREEVKQGPAILTIFTSFKNDPTKFQLYSNTLRNWAEFIPRVRLILYTYEGDAALTELAESLGWLVVISPRLTRFKIPYLKDMFYEAQRQVNDSVFYGYANGDILFDEGLVDTLSSMEQYMDYLEDVLLVGRRYNLRFKNQELYKPADVRAVVQNEGELFRIHAIDYFLIAHNSFVWDKLVDVIIARPAYDNYLVMTAITNDVPVIDATQTILAAHQTDVDGDFAGFIDQSTVHFNREKIGKFPAGQGFTNSTQYFTKISKFNVSHIELWKRTPEDIIYPNSPSKRMRLGKRATFIPDVWG